jgi:ubiquinone/menaquinone biosynthesis C-methylase UbiE
MNRKDDQLREMVRRKYAEIAENARTSGFASKCCGPESGAAYSMIGDAYDGVGGYVADADLGLGCGLPVEHAGLQPGQVVLDLGSGAGLDAFVARRLVGAEGRVIGVDMTAEMVSRARENARRQGLENVEFRLGEIEHLPVRSESVDVAISNCVLNLVPDKRRAFIEIYRVIKPGGHICISDVVSSAPLPDWVKGVAEAYAGCVAGTLPRADYLEQIRAAGFSAIEIAAERVIEVPQSLLEKSLTPEQREAATELGLRLTSITILAHKF